VTHPLDHRETPSRPLLRGWSHALTVVPAGIGGAVLVSRAAGDHLKQVSFALYGASLVLLFAVSAAYHCWTWSAAPQALLRRWDHTNVFVVIASTYTPVAITALGDWLRLATLGTVWGMALLGTLLVTLRVRLPRLLQTGLYLATGWVSLVIMPAMLARVGWAGLAYLGTGGALYSLGALTYAARRPRLWPRVFGYHEVFHLLVVAASLAFYAFMLRHIVSMPRT